MVGLLGATLSYLRNGAPTLLKTASPQVLRLGSRAGSGIRSCCRSLESRVGSLHAVGQRTHRHLGACARSRVDVGKDAHRYVYDVDRPHSTYSVSILVSAICCNARGGSDAPSR